MTSDARATALAEVYAILRAAAKRKAATQTEPAMKAPDEMAA